MENLEKLGSITELFVGHFIKLAQLTKESPVSFGELFISFLLASKIIATAFLEMGIITKEDIVKVNKELDGISTLCKEQVKQIVESMERKEKGDDESRPGEDE